LRTTASWRILVSQWPNLQNVSEPCAWGVLSLEGRQHWEWHDTEENGMDSHSHVGHSSFGTYHYCLPTPSMLQWWQEGSGTCHPHSVQHWVQSFLSHGIQWVWKASHHVKSIAQNVPYGKGKIQQHSIWWPPGWLWLSVWLE
jgi:hypothetical protein